MSEASPPEVEPKPEPEPAPFPRVALALGCGLAAISFAAVGTAVTVNQVRAPGLLLLWLVGVAGGRVAGFLLGESRSRIVGIILGVACYVAALYVYLHFFRYNMVDGEKGWLESARQLPLFLKNNTWSTLIGLIGATLGARSAYEATANRYRYVRVRA